MNLFLERLSIKKISQIILIISLLLIILYFVFLQFLHPGLYTLGEYYHIRLASIIKEFGFNYSFKWAQFSTDKYFFSDKDLLLHIVAIPFLYLSGNIIVSAKYTIIFLNFLFLLIFALILRKYIFDFLIPLFIFSIILSSNFSVNFLYLRTATYVNIFTILGIYFLINKQKIGIFSVSLLYTLGHISFIMLFIFALVCELLRYLYKKEFFYKGLIFSILGIISGIIIHPNFPYNLIYFYLNALLVPFYVFSGKDLGFWKELHPVFDISIFIDNFFIYCVLALIFWGVFISRRKLSFSSSVFLNCSMIYLLLSIFAMHKFWYHTSPLVAILGASYFNDCYNSEKNIRKIREKVIFFLIVFATITAVLSSYYFPSLIKDLELKSLESNHYEHVAKWMKNNIPPGETIYHSRWIDSHYFFGFNPNNSYIFFMDPIFMYSIYPKLHGIYRNLNSGKINDAYFYLKYIFTVRYGYVTKKDGLYQKIQSDSRFRIIYKDKYGIIFKI